jgi:hypothetical protein
MPTENRYRSTLSSNPAFVPLMLHVQIKLVVAFQQEMSTPASHTSAAQSSSEKLQASAFPTTIAPGITGAAPAADAAIETGSSYGLSDEYSYETHPFRVLFFGLFVLGVGGATFTWCGGMRFVRRVLGGRERGKYRKVDDLEK